MTPYLPNRIRALCVAPLAVMWLVSAPVLAQTAVPMKPAASMPHGGMKMGSGSGHDMKATMKMDMDAMNNMAMSGDTDKDFAVMMKMHHQQALKMAEMQLAQGKSAEMKTMAQRIITGQKKEIAQFDKWLAKQK